MSAPLIQNDHQKHRLHHRTRRQLADARRVAFDVHAFIAADHADDVGEDRRLDKPYQEGVDRHRVVQLPYELRNRDAEIEIAHHRAADHGHDVGVEGEKRQGDDERDDARQDQDVDRVEADRLHRVDLLVDLHGTDLGGEGGARTPGHDDRGEKHADFAQNADAERIDGEDFHIEALQLVGALIGNREVLVYPVNKILWALVQRIRCLQGLRWIAATEYDLQNLEDGILYIALCCGYILLSEL